MIRTYIRKAVLLFSGGGGGGPVEPDKTLFEEDAARSGRSKAAFIESGGWPCKVEKLAKLKYYQRWRRVRLECRVKGAET